MKIDYKLIGERIKIERKKKGITQEMMAEKLEVSIGYVSQVERGITKISLDLLGSVSTILDCDISALVTGSAVEGNNYLFNELTSGFLRLDGNKRKLMLEFTKLLLKC